MSTRRSAISEPTAPIPGSYMALMTDALLLNRHGQHQEVVVITERVRSRILRLPERRRSPGSELHEVLIGATALHADSAYKLGDIEAAEALWKTLEQLDQDKTNRWRREPILRRIDRGEVETGLLELNQLVQESPDDGQGWLSLATAALKIDDIDTLEAALERAEPLLGDDETDEDFAGFYFMRHKLHMRQERWREAVNDWYQTIELDEEWVGLNEGVVRELLAAGEYDLALEMLEDETNSEPVQWYYQAWIAHRRGDAVRARYLWRKVVDVKEEDEYSLTGMKAMALCWLDRTKEALALALEEASILHDIPRILAGALALAWAMQGNVESARANLTLATRQPNGIMLLDRVAWYDFDTLIRDDQIKASLREYFDLG